VIALRRTLLHAMAAVAAVAALSACCADPRPRPCTPEGNPGQPELLRLVVTADRDRVPPVPSLSVTVREIRAEATPGADGLPELVVREVIVSRTRVRLFGYQRHDQRGPRAAGGVDPPAAPAHPVRGLGRRGRRRPGGARAAAVR
jgi:hypothetical protein